MIGWGQRTTLLQTILSTNAYCFPCSKLTKRSQLIWWRNNRRRRYMIWSLNSRSSGSLHLIAWRSGLRDGEAARYRGIAVSWYRSTVVRQYHRLWYRRGAAGQPNHTMCRRMNRKGYRKSYIVNVLSIHKIFHFYYVFMLWKFWR